MASWLQKLTRLVAADSRPRATDCFSMPSGNQRPQQRRGIAHDGSRGLKLSQQPRRCGVNTATVEIQLDAELVELLRNCRMPPAFDDAGVHVLDRLWPVT